MRQSIDEALPKILRQASATLSVNKMVKVSGKRINIQLKDRENEIVYYKAAQDSAPVIIAFHSGGWLFGGCALNDRMWSEMSEALGVNIVSVAYRKAPAYKWKESLDDAYESAMYLYEHCADFGFDNKRIYLFGPSAGGNMAAAVCIKSLREGKMIFSRLFLLYPLLDVSTEPALKGPEYYGGPAAYIMNEQHISEEESNDPLASPVFAAVEDLQGFPDTICFVAGNDALKHEGKRFTDKLLSAGCNAACIEEPEMSHCYFELGFRDRLTDFEKDFIGPLGVQAFESGATKKTAYKTLEYIKKELNNDKC